jgi:insulysin
MPSILIRIILSCIFIFASQLPAKNSFIDIEDQNKLEFRSPTLSNRKVAKIQLSNGIKAYIISDEKADQSGAAIAVMAGSWSDPKQYPGMAHFLEHMLFKGTAKYPEEDGFMKYIWDNGGSPNAFTSIDRTVYMFSINNNAFEEAVDRFSHFFIDPLFDESGLERELFAVDQEYAKNIENDGWRKYQISKETGNPNHPNSGFSTGNSSTLKNIPRQEMLKWYKNNYSANLMTIVIYSPKPLEELKQLVTEKFSPVINHGIDQLQLSMPLSSYEQKAHMTYITPIKKMQRLSLEWELPTKFINDESKSAEVIAYVLQRGQKNSLLEYLKEKKLAEDISIETGTLGRYHSVFGITIELTNNGVANINEVIAKTFASINNLKDQAIPEYLFNEMNTMAKINYENQERQDAFFFVRDIVDSLVDEDFTSYPQKTILATQYNPDNIKEILDELTPQNCLYYLQTPSDKVNVTIDRKEKWLGGEYTILPIEQNNLSRWTDVRDYENIKIPLSNKFLPSNLDLISVTEDISPLKHPYKIIDNDKAKCFLAQDNNYFVPQSLFFVNIKSQSFDSTPFASVAKDVLTKHIDKTTSYLTKAANDAGIDAYIINRPYEIELIVSGYSEKSHTLLQEILTKIKETPPPTEEEFSLYVDSLKKQYDNTTKSLPLMQANKMSSHILSYDIPSDEDKTTAITDMSYNDFLVFYDEAFKKTFAEVMLVGNISNNTAESVLLDIQEAFGKEAFIPSDHFHKHVLSLTQEKGPYKITKKTKAMGSGVVLVLQEGEFSYEKKAAQEILSSAMSEAFFTALRTKQKTSYIAQSWPQEIEQQLFQFFAVQSSSHTPSDLINRFEYFLEDYAREIEINIPKDRFDNLRDNLLEKLEIAPKNLQDMAMRLNRLAFEYNEDFKHIDKRIDGYETLTYEEFLSFVKTYLSQSNRGRLAILFEGKLLNDSPFYYEEISPNTLLQKDNYKTKSFKKG